MNTKLAAILLLASAASLAACAKKPPAQLPPVPEDNSGGTTTQPGPQVQPGGAAVGTQDHFAGAVGSSTTIYFETDRYNVDSQDAAALQVQAQYFARYPQITFTVEGHADERGTREYNIALGEKRATSAKNFLVSLGVDPARIAVVSYGKESPVALGSDEASWAQNRRAASVIIN